jgi:hypothetical protein
MGNNSWQQYLDSMGGGGQDYSQYNAVNSNTIGQ